MDVEELSRVNTSEWQSYVGKHPDATVYHTLEWKSILEESYGNIEPAYILTRNNNGDVSGVLPLFKVRGLASSRMESLPLSHITGPLSNDQESLSKLVRAACELSKKTKSDFLELRCSNALDDKTLKAHDLTGFGEYLTVTLDLRNKSDGPFDSLRRDRRRCLKKSDEKGVRVREGGSKNDFRAFYDMLLEVRRTQGVPPYGFRFFENIRRFLAENHMAKLFIAEHEEVVLSGLLVFFYNDTVTAGYGMRRKEKKFLDYHGNDSAYRSAIKFASENKAKMFDFGRCHVKQEYLIDYKVSWGGKKISTPYYYFKNKPGKVAGIHHMSSKYDVFKKIWSVLPLPLTEAVGSRIFGGLI